MNNRAKTSRSRDEKFLDGLFKAIPHNSRVQIAEMIFCLFSLRNRRKTGGFWVSFLERNLISTSGKCHAFRRAQIAEPFLRRFLLRSRRKTGRFSRLRRGNRHENGRQDACGEVRGISPTGAKRAVNDATRNPGRISPSNCAVLP